MNLLFTICGRAGSKGIKNKNAGMFLGKPLVYYTISAIDIFVRNQKSIKNLQYDIALNTDSKELINLVKNNKMQKVSYIDRKLELAGDSVGKVSVIRDTYFEMVKTSNNDYDLIVDLDITSPLRKADDINKVVLKSIDTSADVIFSVTESRRNPYFNMVCREDGLIKKIIDKKFFSRQEAPIVYDMNASIYAYRSSFLAKHEYIFDGNVDIVEMMDTAVLDLDKPNDLVFMEIIAKYLIKEDNDINAVYVNIK